MNVKTIRISKDYSRTPGGRYRTDGEFSGQRFREEILVDAFLHEPPFDKISISLDGVLGYGSSFLEESFGGLVREEHFDKSDVLRRLELTAKASRFKVHIKQVEQYIKDAEPE